MSIPDQLTSSLAGRYTIEREIGRGGMATVFLARDLRHERHVALKVLNPELGAVLGVDRFLAEIRVTANLQHPNLLPLFDSGEVNGLLFYVMPYVDGESLRARLDRDNQLPVDEAIRIALAVSSALEYAHARGVVHRDLKPENILLQSGQPVVADFGIALAVSNAGGTRVTQTGLSLGTPQYMSPEQAAGDRAIDGRSDIYSLAAVLYETLAGEPPHSGHTVQAVIARVLTERPRSVRTLRPSVSEQVEGTIARGLEKLPADRWATARDFADALQGKSIVARPAAFSDAFTAAAPRSRLRDPIVLALGALALAGAALGMQGLRSDNDAVTGFPIRVPIKVDRPPDEGGWFSMIAISPDGKTVAYSQRFERVGMWVRSIEEVSGRLLVPGGLMPFFSPDGAWLGSRTPSGWLTKTPLNGDGRPIQLFRSSGYLAGAAWAANDTIILSIDNRLMMLPDDGGTPTPLIPIDTAAGERGQRSPRVLADGLTILYESLRGDAEESRVGIVSIPDRKANILDVAGVPIGVVDGYLVFGTSRGALNAIAFDARRRQVEGSPVQMVNEVDVTGRGLVRAALSPTGTLVYAMGSPNTQVVRTDLKGNAEMLVDEPRNYSAPRFSPDGNRLAFSIGASARTDIWIRDLASQTTSVLTTDGMNNNRPEWHPDGKRVSYVSNREGGRSRLWLQNADFSGKPQPIEVAAPGITRNEPVALGATTGVISPADSQVVAFIAGSDLWYYTLGVDTIAQPITSPTGVELAPKISPDGKWIAYGTGDMHIYVQPLPPTGANARYKITEEGGMTPVWSPQSDRIYYAWADSLRAATIRTSPTFTVLRRETLFGGDYVLMLPPNANYDVSPDGKSLVLLKRVDSGEQLVVVHDWKYELRQRTRSARR